MVQWIELQDFRVDYDCLLYAIGALGALAAVVMLEYTEMRLLTIVSLSFNLILFFYAYTLHEGWHQSEPEGEE